MDVLLSYDRQHGTDHFLGVAVDDVVDHETRVDSILEAALLPPASVTADFNFLEWSYEGRGPTVDTGPFQRPPPSLRAVASVGTSIATADNAPRSAGTPIVRIVETWDAIRARRNVRAYEDEPILHRHLDRILEAARRSPSSTNQQAWDFVVVTDRERLRDLSKVWNWAAHVGTSAATIALVMPATNDPEERETFQFDLGQATMSIMLAAADLGIGSCHASVGDQELASELLGLPEDRECPLLVSLGYPAGRPLAQIARPKRRPFDDVVHRQRW